MTGPVLYLDFETTPILSRRLSAVPFLCAVKNDDDDVSVLCLPEQKAELMSMVEAASLLVAHNAAFELEMLEHYDAQTPFHLGSKPVHCTMMAEFIMRPFLGSYSLKKLMPQQEAVDEIEDWLTANWRTWGGRYGLTRRPARKGIRKYVCAAPLPMVVHYARSDVAVLHKLHRRQVTEIASSPAGLSRAIGVEMALLPVLMENSRRGVRVDMEELERQEALLITQVDACVQWLRDELDDQTLEVCNAEQMGHAFQRTGVIDLTTWPRTERTGRLSMSKAGLEKARFLRRDIADVYFWSRTAHNVVHNTLANVRKYQEDGKVHTRWNQTRYGFGGSMTGRIMSSCPNLNNIPKRMKPCPLDRSNEAEAVRPRSIFRPPEGLVWLTLDYSSQEFRIAAEYEKGWLYERYTNDPKFDGHVHFGDMLSRRLSAPTLEALRERYSGMKEVGKKINFTIIYGGGLEAIEKSLQVSSEVAQEVMECHRMTFPDLHTTIRIVRGLGESQTPCYTLGGRPYVGVGRGKAFQLFNYLCQGSASDMMKRALVSWGIRSDECGAMQTTVYDEMSVSCSRDHVAEIMSELSECMADVSMKVPIVTKVARQAPSW